MRTRSPDLATLVAGLVLVTFGALLVLQRLDVLDLGFAALWPALVAGAGAVLLAGGRERRGRGDDIAADPEATGADPDATGATLADPGATDATGATGSDATG